MNGNFIHYKLKKKMYGILISSLLFDNKSLIISMFSFAIAKKNAVW